MSEFISVCILSSNNLKWGFIRVNLVKIYTEARHCNLVLHLDAAQPTARLRFRLSRRYVQIFATELETEQFSEAWRIRHNFQDQGGKGGPKHNSLT